jgi:pyruvate-ferredoxin/flavodoxin oxidoreductase
LRRLAPQVGESLATELLDAKQTSEADIRAQRERVALLKVKLAQLRSVDARNLQTVADALVKRVVWIVGGDGWAYDIGFGGLDHVLASGRNVKVLVLDSEVYSNTGGQMSKSTPRAAVAKFAAAGKPTAKKDLALTALNYGSVYVARVAMGAGDMQTVKTFLEAEAYEGPALIIAYAHCIAHGFDLTHGLQQQKLAVQSGHWPLFRFNPALEAEGKNPFQLDSNPPSVTLETYLYNENRYTMLKLAHPEQAQNLLRQAQRDIQSRWRIYEQLAKAHESGNGHHAGEQVTAAPRQGLW